MAHRTSLTLAAALAALLLPGCFDEPPLPESGASVFGDGFTTGFTPNAFAGSLLTSLSVDGTKAYSGTASIKLAVPGTGAFSGGAVLADAPQDLSGTNALVFWATASRAATFDKLGFGLNFNPLPSTYQATLINLPLTPEWVRHYIPIPNPARLTAEHGMLWYADGDATGYSAWFDEVKFDLVDEAALNLRPSIATASTTIGVGATATVGGRTLLYTDFDGAERAVDSTDTPGSGPAAAYFTFTSSNPAVATVDAAGVVTGVSNGQAIVTARLGARDAAGALTVNVGNVAPQAPTTAPPAPALPAADVISLLSKGYTNVGVDTWGTTWSNNSAGPNLTEVTIGGDPMKKYTSLLFVGIETTGANLIDASAMTHFHLDVWTPDATILKVKLVDFGAGGAFGGGDDTEHELTFNAGSTPALATGTWLQLDLPLSSFTGLTNRAHVAQLILSSSTATVFVDNVYFHK